MKVLYIDACAGASGDMLAGALLDLGWPLDELKKLIKQMGLEHEANVSIDHPVHQSIRTTRLNVELLEALPKSHHDHAHHHDHDHTHHHEHHKETHDHHAVHHHSHNHHNMRGLSQILQLLQTLPENIAKPASQVFHNLAVAEAKVHGCDVEDVHFHEVGAVDAIVDIVAFCAGIAWLKPNRILCSSLPLGRGFVHCAHGVMPLPAPAVLNLLEGVPVTSWNENQETVTPTGAALLSTLVDEFVAMPAFTLLKTGIGGGSRPSTTNANLLRMLWGRQQRLLNDQVAEISCNVDDQLGEDFPFISEKLMSAGALDVAAVPLLMKKGRPALRIDVLCHESKVRELAALLLEQTTSLGVRVAQKQRYLLPRQTSALPTPWGEVKIKSAQLASGALRYHPEAEDVLRISRETGLAPSLVRQKIFALLSKDN